MNAGEFFYHFITLDFFVIMGMEAKDSWGKLSGLMSALFVSVLAKIWVLPFLSSLGGQGHLFPWRSCGPAEDLLNAIA